MNSIFCTRIASFTDIDMIIGNSLMVVVLGIKCKCIKPVVVEDTCHLIRICPYRY